MNEYIKKMLAHNRCFVDSKSYQTYMTDKYPSTGIAILTCMDTRLTELLPRALNLKNGDVKMIKNAGGFISDMFSDSVRSLLVGIYELHVNEIMVIGHTQCGVQGLTGEFLLEQMKDRGISEAAIDSLRTQKPDLTEWLNGFPEVTDSVRETVRLLREHPLIPADVHIGGYLMDVVTGELTVL